MIDNELLARRPDEDDLSYHRRLVFGKLVDGTLSDCDYTELAQYVYGKEYSSDVARRMMYGSCRTLKLLEDVPDERDPDAADDLRRRKEELVKERIKLQTEKSEYLKWMREDARDEMFESKVISAILAANDPPPPPAPIAIRHGKRRGLLCMADAHFGKEYSIKGLTGEIINAYSPEIFYERMEKMLAETLDIVEREDFSEITVFNLGDSVEGFIRNSQIWSLRWGVIDSAIYYGNYMGNWLRRLSEKVCVRYMQTDGNHDELRLLDGKKGQHLNESAGKIIRNCIELINSNNPNIDFVENDTGCVFEELCGYNILGIHGETDLRNAISEYEDIYNVKLSYLIGGHKHHREFDECGQRRASMSVGSIIGIDQYSMDLRKTADATASFFVFEENKGKVCEYTIVLN